MMSFFTYSVSALLLFNILPAFAVPTLPLRRTPEHQRQDPVRLIYEYPVGTWIENLAVRANGELLLTQYTLGRLDLLNPLVPHPEPEIIFKFPNYTSATGIAEIAPDVFAVGVGNYVNTPSSLPPSGSSIWKAAFVLGNEGGANATVTKITDVPDATELDGLCNVPSTQHYPNSVLAGDVKTGNVWRVNTSTGAQEVVLDNNYTAATALPFFGVAGVNGLHIRNATLYFTNSGEGIFARVAVDAAGRPSGAVQVIAHELNATTQYYDDFTLRGEHAYLVTGFGNSVEKLALDGARRGRIVAGNLNSTEIAQPTSCAFGRTPADDHILYVVTGGGLLSPVNGNETVGAQVLAIDTRFWD